MENWPRRWAAARMAAALVGVIVTTAGAEPARRIVLHVCFGDTPTASQLEALEKAQQHSSEIYDAFGVSLLWATHETAADTREQAVHLRVLVLSDDRATRLMEDLPVPTATALGAAPLATGRIYLFWDRIVRHAQKQKVLTAVVLGRVIAHEVGHHLLPGVRHSEHGLMRRSLNYRSPPPAFTAAQMASIRARLAAAN